MGTSIVRLFGWIKQRQALSPVLRNRAKSWRSVTPVDGNARSVLVAGLSNLLRDGQTTSNERKDIRSARRRKLLLQQPPATLRRALWLAHALPQLRPGRWPQRNLSRCIRGDVPANMSGEDQPCTASRCRGPCSMTALSATALQRSAGIRTAVVRSRDQG